MYPCFLIEAIYDEPGSMLPDKGWDPLGRSIMGWIRKDTGEERQHNSQFGVGAMWFATWQSRNWDWENETEPHLLVRCPNGEGTRDWDIDSRCSNCGLPSDKIHRCWVRHGTPPLITVDKHGVTCNAGAGSIALPKWHGFLRNGSLVLA